MLGLKQSAFLLAAILLGSAVSQPVSYFYDVPIDHKNLSMGTFKMQYMVDTQYFYNLSLATKQRPILFYAGNEGAIGDFYKNSGFMTTTLAEQQGALVVFAEHRYFGNSWPFRKNIAFQSPYNSYLTVENVLADYADLLGHIRVQYEAQDKAVIAFGGSYGGMLAAWMRMKYPHVVQGALAASAPVLYFKGVKTLKAGIFAEIASNDFNITGKDGDKCYNGVKSAFGSLISKGDQPGYTKNVSAVFKTCQNLTHPDNITSLTDSLRSAFFYMAMTDYPNSASFLEPMPANPINVSCSYFANYTDDMEDKLVFEMLDKAAQVYFNWANKTDFCYDITDTDATGTLDAGGWDVLSCNQIAMPQTNGMQNTSIFVVDDDIFDYDAWKDSCQQKYNLTPNYNWAVDQFGGKHNYSQEFRQYSNIIFSNGQLDPWRGGGVERYVSDKIYTFNIEGGAHHLDLRLPNNDTDPESVKYVRGQEASIIDGWIYAYQPRPVNPNPPPPPVPPMDEEQQFFQK